MSIRWIPNAFTILRMVGAVALLVIEPISAAFYVVYSLSGISDVLDGTFARLLHCTTESGARLDSISDILFYTAMLLRLFPILMHRLPGWIWIWVSAILLVRLAAYICAYVKFRTFASLHTWLNKLTGLLVFLVPFTLSRNETTVFCTIVCAVGMAASVEELAMHIRAEQYDPRGKSFFHFAR